MVEEVELNCSQTIMESVEKLTGSTLAVGHVVPMAMGVFEDPLHVVASTPKKGSTSTIQGVHDLSVFIDSIEVVLSIGDMGKETVGDSREGLAMQESATGTHNAMVATLNVDANPSAKELDLSSKSEDEGDWSPGPWGKKGLIIDEFDKKKVQKSKGKKKKGCRRS